MKKAKHILRLNGFDFAKGRIPFSFLNQLSSHLLKISEETILMYIEGRSKVKKGKQPEWLKKSLDFNLCAVKRGSTVLEIETPFLRDTLKNIQIPVIDNFNFQSIEDNTALSLSMYTYQKALDGDKNSFLLDKNLLNSFYNFNKLFKNEKCSVDLKFVQNDFSISIKNENLLKIKRVEEKTPESQKVRITGKLDVMKHSNSQLEIISEEKRIRAFLGEKLSFNKVREFFGEDITITGIANFNLSGNITSIELLNLKKSESDDYFFNKIPKPMNLEFDLKQIIKEKNYKGFDKLKFDKIINEINLEESVTDLLNSLSR